MKALIYLAGMLAAGLYIVSPAAAQETETDSETVYESTDTTVYESTGTRMSGGNGAERYISSPVFIDDAVPQPAGSLDFRLRFDYVTQTNRSFGDRRRGFWGNRNDHRARHGDDDFGVGQSLFWGPCENAEISLDLPYNLGDGKDSGDGLDGNTDLTIGLLYRFWQEQDWLPAFAMSSKLRLPTGHDSSGVDAEFRGHLTKTIAGDLRGHANAFLITVNGNNDPDLRHFQWGFVFGVDFPLTAAKDLWMILDYVHRSSEHYGASNMNMAEAGIEWEFAEGKSFHFSTQVGLDDNEDTPNWGARIGYTHELWYK